MPTYEYRCKDCGQELEATQSFNDDPLTECPSCQGLLKKRFSAVGISFKGGGFYKNDSRSGAKSSSVPAGTSESSTSTAGGASTDGASGSGGSTDTSTAPTTKDAPTTAPAPSAPSTSGSGTGSTSSTTPVSA